MATFTKLQHAQTAFANFNLQMTELLERLKMKYFFLALINEKKLTAGFDVSSDGGKTSSLRVDLSVEQVSANLNQMETELRRSFIGDLYSICDYFCTYLDNVLRDKEKDGQYLPAFFTEKIDKPLTRVNRFLAKDQKEFLEFLHAVRNAMIHHNGMYNASSQIDYKFAGLEFKTAGNLGKQIIWSPESLVHLWNKCASIFVYEDFNKNPQFLKESGQAK